jgi:hypothetical protein
VTRQSPAFTIQADDNREPLPSCKVILFVMAFGLMLGSLRRKMRFLTDLPRWSLLALLVLAPWAYGTTPQWTIDSFTEFSLSIVALWLAGLIVRRRRPRVPPIALGCVLFFLIQGWWMILNAQFAYDPAKLGFVAIPCFSNFLPGDLDRASSLPAMLRISALLGLVCLVCDMAQRTQWRRRISWTIGLAGVSLIIYGLILKIASVPWAIESGDSFSTYFAMYLYHANAGAFINLVLPPIAGLAIIAMRTEKANASRAIWVPGTVICLAGAIATASKAAMVVTALLVLTLGVSQLLQLFKKKDKLWLRKEFWIGLTGAIVLLAGIGAIGWENAMQRWSNTANVESSWEARWLTWGACTHMLPDSGVWGFGAGSFGIAFPHYTAYLGDRIFGLWEFAHEDYLQTIIEWGWVGAAGWGVFFFGGIASGWRNHSKSAGVLSRTDRMLIFTSALALAGLAAHSLVDFPLQIASLQLYAATYLGLTWGCSYWSRGGDQIRG